MPLTPKLTQIGFFGFLLFAAVGCGSQASQTPVQPEVAATASTPSPESQVTPAQPPSSPQVTAPPPVSPPQPSPVTSVPPQPSQPSESSDPTLLVQEFCAQKGQKVEQYFETNNFQIYLCYDNSNQMFYYGVDKRNGAAIALPAYTEEGTGYVAENGDYDYIVTGASLSVYQNSKLLLEENVLRSL